MVHNFSYSCLALLSGCNWEGGAKSPRVIDLEATTDNATNGVTAHGCLDDVIVKFEIARAYSVNIKIRYVGGAFVLQSIRATDP